MRTILSVDPAPGAFGIGLGEADMWGGVGVAEISISVGDSGERGSEQEVRTMTVMKMQSRWYMCAPF
jgi:hypothetical protein